MQGFDILTGFTQTESPSLGFTLTSVAEASSEAKADTKIKLKTFDFTDENGEEHLGLTAMEMERLKRRPECTKKKELEIFYNNTLPGSEQHSANIEEINGKYYQCQADEHWGSHATCFIGAKIHLDLNDSNPEGPPTKDG